LKFQTFIRQKKNKMYRLTMLALFILANLSVDAQDFFLKEFKSHSKKKITYISMDNGDKFEVNLMKFKFTKGQIDELKFKAIDAKKKVKVKVDDIKSLYVPASALEKIGNALAITGDATRWSNKEISTDLISKDYYYFEKSPTRVKKKSFDTVNQVLNPYTSKYIKIFPDYRAKKTASFGIAGVKVAGGIEKSYYIRFGDKVAYRIKKGDYKEQFPLIFSDCPELLEKYSSGANWSDLATHIREYTEFKG